MPAQKPSDTSASVEPAASTAPAEATRVRQQVEVWRERLIDVSQRNPLLGLNRSRVSKLKVVEPAIGVLYDRLVVQSGDFRLPIVRRRVTELTAQTDLFDAVTPSPPKPGSEGVDATTTDELPDRAALEDAATTFTHAAALRRGRARLDGEIPSLEPVVVSAATRAAASRVQSDVVASTPLDGALALLSTAWNGQFVETAAPADAPLGSLASRCAEAETQPTLLAEWVVLQYALNRAEQAGLTSFVEAIPNEDSGRAVALFRRRFWQAWTNAHIHHNDALKWFGGRRREQLVGEFRQLDERLREAIRGKNQDGAAQLAARITETAEYARDSQLGILKYDLQRKRPRPLRRLFADVPLVLQAIKPCMLMSPVSVSTYLTPGSITFDLVVFDEASQLPPQEAIPAILRARQVVVAGDDKQLPPTSFFSSSLFTEEQQETDEAVAESVPLESLLRQCAATVPFFQESWLRWHYRSRDERLIAFSNNQFYEGTLVTFPVPAAPADRGVQLRHVADGVWDRGRSRQNRPEARAVVEEIFKQFDSHPERSIGVVALSATQKEAIEDALDEGLAARPDLRERLSEKDSSEPFFVKSLENVQGDERDTIIISTGYGPDASGTLHLNFGPLNLEGGWRRLNVLVTRAKYLVMLVTSLRSNQLGAVAPSNRGAIALREYLAYAERGGRLAVEAPRLTDAETNDFEDAIAGALRARGLVVDEQVGASSFRIDLAVRDPRDSSRYLLGVGCDGASYHSSRAARDRDRVRADMLRGMGWRLHRIWSLDWFRDPVRTIDAAVHAVERAMTLGEPSQNVTAPPTVPLLEPNRETLATPPFMPSMRYSAGTPYQRAPTADRPDRDMLIQQSMTERLVDALVRIVVHEGPIHPEELLDRVKEHNLVQRAGDNIRRNVLSALERALQEQRIQADSDVFLWKPGAVSIQHFRLASSSGPRTIERIPNCEIRLAVLHVVESQFALPRDTLVRSTARALGYGSTSQQIFDRISNVADGLLEAGELRRNGPDQMSLP